MKIFSLEPFIPSGENFDGAKQLFQEIGFSIDWDAGDYVGFQKDGSRFILQRYNNKAFAENLMINVKIDDAQAFWEELNEKEVVKRFGVRITPPKQQPYGKEVNLVDAAGVCWHFVE